MTGATPQSPIGIFDSGVGGLSVFEDIRRLMPREDLLYVADSGHAPYGDRDRAFVQSRADALAGFLVDRGAKALVVACNTATEMAIEGLRARYTLPIVGMEPAIKTGIASTKSGTVGVLATRATVSGRRVASLIERYAEGAADVLLAACPEFVPLVEVGHTNDQAAASAVTARVEPLLRQGADVLVLGCTHFHFLLPAIEKAAGPSVKVIESGAAVARQLQKLLTDAGLLNAGPGPGAEAFWTTGDLSQAMRVFAALLGRAVDVNEINGSGGFSKNLPT